MFVFSAVSLKNLGLRSMFSVFLSVLRSSRRSGRMYSPSKLSMEAMFPHL